MLYGYPWMSFSINLFWWQSVWVVVLMFLNRISINDEFLMYVPNFFIYKIFYVVCFLKIHCKCTSTHSMIHHICFVAVEHGRIQITWFIMFTLMVVLIYIASVLLWFVNNMIYVPKPIWIYQYILFFIWRCSYIFLERKIAH